MNERVQKRRKAPARELKGLRRKTGNRRFCGCNCGNTCYYAAKPK